MTLPCTSSVNNNETVAEKNPKQKSEEIVNKPFFCTNIILCHIKIAHPFIGMGVRKSENQAWWESAIVDFIFCSELLEMPRS